MKIEDIYKIKEQKIELENDLKKISNSLNKELNNYMVNYFSGKVPSYLPFSKNQFINIYNNIGAFTVEKGESGKVYWKVSGFLTTVKDGKVTHGHSSKTLFQGEFEAMSLEMQNNTVENAKKLTEPVFPIIPQSYNGTNFSNYAYELARKDELGIVLVWRKAGTAYIDRMTKSLADESSLQILITRNDQVKKELRDKKFNDLLGSESVSNDIKEILPQLKSLSYVDIFKGGRLNKDVILKHEKIIGMLFDPDTVNNIVTKLDTHLKVKKMKTIISKEDVEKQKKEAEEDRKKRLTPIKVEEVIVNGKSIKY